MIKCPLNKSINENHADHGNDIVKFYLNLPYLGIVEGMLVKSTLEIQKQRNKQTKKSNIKSDTRVTFKLSFHTSTKYRIDRLTHCHIVYRFCCPGYIGKRKEHFLIFWKYKCLQRSHTTSVVYNHINNCDGVKYLVDLLDIDQVQTERDKFDKKIYSVATVKENISIINMARRWDILLFKEQLHIKEKNSTLNNGLKASKQLKLI